MCGICLSIAFFNRENESSFHHFKSDIYKYLIQCLQRRGPDSFNEISEVLDGKFHLFMCSSVLHLRGSDMTAQPICDEKGNIFLWNGEIFDGPLISTESDSINSMSDSNVIAEKLFNSKNVPEVLQIISFIKGPYALIYYQQADGLIWFGRDIFGRRSLLWNFQDSAFQLCSIATEKHDKWTEVPTSGIFCLDLNLSFSKQTFVIHQYSWYASASGYSSNIAQENPVQTFAAEIRPSTNIFTSVPIFESLNRSVPSDSSNLLHFMTELQNSKLSKQEIFQKMLDFPILKDTVNDFENILSQAVNQRVREQLNLCKTCYSRLYQSNSTSFCDHSFIGVLFSGGLDSIVLAYLVHKYVDHQCSIDLINVAFANEKTFGAGVNVLPFNTPDRVTGKTGYKALKDTCQSRNWKFVEVNVTVSELNDKREQCISELLYPSCTVLDDSIGCALWFAARGEGCLEVEGQHLAYKSPSRVLFVGMGADEQLAGYSRHRAKFKNASWSGLVEEIALEIDRIGSRNLGRDDRIIADSGVESRYPFLDENVVSFLNSLPICLKANLNFERGVGEKLLLRLLAFKLGLSEAAVLPKRAIQFGSRIAKLENHKEKGSDICKRLTQSVS